MHILTGILMLVVLGIFAAADGDWSVLGGLFRIVGGIAVTIGLLYLMACQPAVLILIIIVLIFIAVTFG